MINLRYHIVSLTAVFLAIGIGLAFGSSFLDQATVNSLERQLDGLQAGLTERDQRISDLGDQISDLTTRQESLDAEGAALLSGRAAGVPVVVIANDGADEDAVAELVTSLSTADAEVAGVWRLTDRFVLDDDSEVADLTEVAGVPSATPTMLRRSSVDALAAVIARRQDVPLVSSDDSSVPDDPTTPDADTDGTGEAETDAQTDDGTGEAETDAQTGDAPDQAEGEPTVDDTDGSEADRALVDGLFDRGFIEYTPMPGGPDRPFVPDGARIVLVGGADALPDGWILVPLAEELQDGPAGTALVVATAAATGDEATSTLVTTVRESTDLRDQVSSVEDASHFIGQAAIVLVVADLGEGPVGHYGLAEGSSRLLPAPPGS